MNKPYKDLLKLQETSGLKAMRDCARQVIHDAQDQLKMILEELHERERAAQGDFEK